MADQNIAFLKTKGIVYVQTIEDIDVLNDLRKEYTAWCYDSNATPDEHNFFKTMYLSWVINSKLLRVMTSPYPGKKCWNFSIFC